MLKTYFAPKPLDYDGSQLHSLFAFNEFDVQGSSLVGFIGACQVDMDNIVDQQDVKDQKFIFSHQMVHFVLELFELDLERGVLYQRLLVDHLKKELELQKKSLKLERRGNDLYDGKAKLNVSIATLSPVSTLIHVGINVISKETPVLTKGLKDYGIVPATFAKNILKNFSAEYESIQMSRTKVRGVS